MLLMSTEFDPLVDDCGIAERVQAEAGSLRR